MKALWVGALLAAIVGVEIFHELWRGDAVGAAVCSAPQTQQDALRDMLVQHLRSH